MLSFVNDTKAFGKDCEKSAKPPEVKEEKNKSAEQASEDTSPETQAHKNAYNGAVISEQ